VDNSQVYEKFDWDSLTDSSLSGKISRIFETIPGDVNEILDVGCGNGVITNALGDKYNVTGVDRSTAALKSVKTKKVQASADNIPLDDNSFDMVFSSELLEHLDDQTLDKTVSELCRISKKYIFITVPNAENPDKLSIKCPNCKYIYNRPNHLRSFNSGSLINLFADFELVTSFTYGRKVRYYNNSLLRLKRAISPADSWIPYFWIDKNSRSTICPSCEHEFENEYRFCIRATGVDTLNAIISPKKPYWLFALMRKK